MIEKKYIAQIVIETTSPLVVGSGKSEIDSDAIVARDFNFLPYIPGTGLIGILRSLFENKYDEIITTNVFGGEDEIAKSNEKETFLGSSIIISDALLVDEDGTVTQTAVTKYQLSDFHKIFLNLPKREHVRINHKGTAIDKGKFDNKIVFKGARFKFEIELTKNTLKNGKDYWNFLLDLINSTDFLLGGGTTNNYGQTKIINIKKRDFDLSKKDDFDDYLNHTTDLNKPFEKAVEIKNPKKIPGQWSLYKTLALKTNSIHIGAGYGDLDVYETNYKEQVLIWGEDGKHNWETYFVIPGSSIKGALSHRVAFHKNKSDKFFVETLISNATKTILKDKKLKIEEKFKDYNKQITEIKNGYYELVEKKEKLNELIKVVENYIPENFEINDNIFDNYIGESNSAVKSLFGFAKDSGITDGNIGKIIVDDIYIREEDATETIFEHNAIDRFTGGTIDTALYSEKVFTPTIPILLNLKIFKKENIELQELERVFCDLAVGHLALGGKTNKGYGFFEEVES